MTWFVRGLAWFALAAGLAAVPACSDPAAPELSKTVRIVVDDASAEAYGQRVGASLTARVQNTGEQRVLYADCFGHGLKRAVAGDTLELWNTVFCARPAPPPGEIPGEVKPGDEITVNVHVSAARDEWPDSISGEYQLILGIFGPQGGEVQLVPSEPFQLHVEQH